MGFDRLMGTVMRLTTQAEAAAALGAHLALEGTGEPANPATVAQLRRVVAALGPDLLDDVTPRQRETALGAIRALLQQALDLLAEPGRAPGWTHTDPSLLQSTGQTSVAIAPVIASIAPQLPGLDDALRQPSARILDVGAGVGALAIAFCRTFPQATVVGLEPWEPPRLLAEHNVATAGMQDRVELRPIVVEDLDDRDAFDLVWLAGPFLPEPVLPTAVANGARSLRPNGWLVLGFYAGPDDPLAEAIVDLRTVRSGGCLVTNEHACRLLRDAGLSDVREVERTWTAPVRLVVGRWAPA